MGWIVWLWACAGSGSDDTATGDPCAASAAITDYSVDFSTDPATPTAGEEATFTLQVLDQRGCPVQSLQQAHERMVHTIFISQDLSAFQHLHEEDFTTITADDLRTATFHFPVTLPMSGDYRLVFDFADANQYLARDGWMTADGSPAQSDTLALDYSSPRVTDGLSVSLEWDVAPYAGLEAEWTIHIQTADGTDVTDLVQWLGADAHAAVATSDLAYVSHTHAWFPDMDGTPPGHTMPHLYSGPDLPFHYVFPTAGTYKMWVQFAREDAPDAPYLVDFAFDVAP
jgi:hypothetical protein